jgi:hypothetical protein
MTHVAQLERMLRNHKQRVRSLELSLTWWTMLAAALAQITGPSPGKKRFHDRARETGRRLLAARARCAELEDMVVSVGDDERLAEEVLTVDRMRFGRTHASVTDQRGKYGTGMSKHVSEEGERMSRRASQRAWQKRHPAPKIALPEVPDPIKVIASALADFAAERARYKEELVGLRLARERRPIVRDLLRVEADMAALGFRVADPTPKISRPGRPPKVELTDEQKRKRRRNVNRWRF